MSWKILAHVELSAISPVRETVWRLRQITCSINSLACCPTSSELPSAQERDFCLPMSMLQANSLLYVWCFPLPVVTLPWKHRQTSSGLITMASWFLWLTVIQYVCWRSTSREASAWTMERWSLRNARGSKNGSRCRNGQEDIPVTLLFTWRGDYRTKTLVHSLRVNLLQTSRTYNPWNRTNRPKNARRARNLRCGEASWVCSLGRVARTTRKSRTILQRCPKALQHMRAQRHWAPSCPPQLRSPVERRRSPRESPWKEGSPRSIYQWGNPTRENLVKSSTLMTSPE